MKLNVTRNGDRIRFIVEGNIDEKGAEILQQRFNDLDTANVREFILDVGKVGYICSAGVGKLLLLYKELTSNGGSLCIENDTGIVRELFSIARTNTIFGASSSCGQYLRRQDREVA